MKLKFDANSYTYNLFTIFYYVQFVPWGRKILVDSLSTRHITCIKRDRWRSPLWNSFCFITLRPPVSEIRRFKHRLNSESSVLHYPCLVLARPSHSHAPFFRSLAPDSFTATLVAPLARCTDLPHCPLTRWVSLFFFLSLSLSPPSSFSLSRAPTFHYRYYATCVFPRRRSGSRRFRGFRPPFNFPRASRRRISRTERDIGVEKNASSLATCTGYYFLDIVYWGDGIIIIVSV